MVNCTNYYVKTTDTTKNETWNCWPSESHDLIPDFVRVYDIGVFFVLFYLSVVFVFVFFLVLFIYFVFVVLELHFIEKINSEHGTLFSSL